MFWDADFEIINSILLSLECPDMLILIAFWIVCALHHFLFFWFHHYCFLLVFIIIVFFWNIHHYIFISFWWYMILSTNSHLTAYICRFLRLHANCVLWKLNLCFSIIWNYGTTYFLTCVYWKPLFLSDPVHWVMLQSQMVARQLRASKLFPSTRR